MVAQWTAEDEIGRERQFEAANNVAQERPSRQPSQPVNAVPINHENAFKWYYRDPQDEVQGEQLLTIDIYVLRECVCE